MAFILSIARDVKTVGILGSVIVKNVFGIAPLQRVAPFLNKLGRLFLMLSHEANSLPSEKKATDRPVTA